MSFRGQPSEEQVQELQRRVAELYGEPSAKHVGEGVAKGVFSVGKGIFTGLGTLVASPIVGLAEEGGVGFFKGVATGVVHGGVIVGSGLFIGACQVGSGIVHTPEAVKKLMQKNKTEQAAEAAEFLTDEDVRQANARSYAASRKEVEDFVYGDGTAGKAGGYGATAVPAETALYELLRVGPTASQRDILCSFYQLSNDEAPGEKLDELAEGARVLLDPSTRAKYDEEGKAALGEVLPVGGQVLTSMLFGSKALEPWVGQYAVAHTALGTVTLEQCRQWQAEREGALAVLLAQRLEPWMKGDKEAFVGETLSALKGLREGPFGEPIVQCMGYTYYHMAEACLGLESDRTVPEHLLAGLMLEKLKPVSDASGAGEPIKDASIPSSIDALWLINALDIESTVRKVVESLITDGKLSEEDKRQRACAILRLGKIFLEA